jgi:hypothetical protein
MKPEFRLASFGLPPEAPSFRAGSVHAWSTDALEVGGGQWLRRAEAGSSRAIKSAGRKLWLALPQRERARLALRIFDPAGHLAFESAMNEDDRLRWRPGRGETRAELVALAEALRRL